MLNLLEAPTWEDSDFAAEQVGKLIVDFKKMHTICDSAKCAVILLLKKNVREMSLRQMAGEFHLGKTSIDAMLYAGKFFCWGTIID